MKKITLITSYFPPETGAASNRIHHLAQGLSENGFKVAVITPMPNYPKGKIFEGYRGHFKKTYTEEGLKVHRIWVYASNSKNIFLRLMAMLSFSFGLMLFFLTKKLPKTVIVQSPPLLVAFTCMLFLKRKNRQLILNVSDLWPLAGLELGALKKGFGYSLLERIERHNYKKADLILGQSQEILHHITYRYPEKRTFLYRNFPDFIPPEISSKNPTDKKIKMVYAGLLGVAQGILKLCEHLDYSPIEFHIYGVGPEQESLEEFINNHPDLPIFYHGEVTRAELHSILLGYDFTIIPLLNRIYGSVPSKIFEYARIGLPMLYFGGGEGEVLVLENNLGWTAEAGNYESLNAVLKTIKKEDLSLAFKHQIRETALKQFDFDRQLIDLSAYIQ